MKDKKEMSQFENFVTEGNETADKLAKAGAMLDKGFMAEARAKTVQQAREREKKCMQLCNMRPAFSAGWRSSSRSQNIKWIFVDQKREETKQRTEWCAEANKYRCMRCGRGSTYMKMQGQCTQYLSKIRGSGKATFGRPRYVRKI